MRKVRTKRQFSIIITVAILLISVGELSLADDAPGASLAAKGARIKTEKDGTVTEIYFPPTTELTLEDFAALGKLVTLKSIYSNARGVPLNDQTALELTHLDKLEKFFVNGAELTDEGFRAFEGWKSLKTFGLDHWGWHVAPKGGTLGPGLAHLTSCPNLESVRLGGCRVDNRVTEAMAQIKSLQKIDIQHTTAVTDEGIPALKLLPKLRIVRLNPGYDPRCTDASLIPLGDIKTLEELDLVESWFTYDKGFSNLKNLASLKKILLTKVIADDDDIARLKADHPTADVQWTKPDDATIAKTKDQFQRYWVKQKK